MNCNFKKLDSERVTQWIECQIPVLMVVGSIPAMLGISLWNSLIERQKCKFNSFVLEYDYYWGCSGIDTL